MNARDLILAWAVCSYAFTCNQANAEDCRDGDNIVTDDIYFYATNQAGGAEELFKIPAKVERCQSDNSQILGMYKLHGCTSPVFVDGDTGPLPNINCPDGTAQSNAVVTIGEEKTIDRTPVETVTGLVSLCVPIDNFNVPHIPEQYSALGVCLATDLLNNHYNVYSRMLEIGHKPQTFKYDVVYPAFPNMNPPTQDQAPAERGASTYLIHSGKRRTLLLLTNLSPPSGAVLLEPSLPAGLNVIPKMAKSL